MRVVVRVVVGVDVALEKRGLDVLGRDLAASRLDVLVCRGGGKVGGVRFRRGRKHNGGVRERNSRLGHTKLARGFTASARDDGCHRVGKSDVLARDDLHSSANGKKLARREELVQVKHSGVGVGASDRLLQSGEEVKVDVIRVFGDVRLEGRDVGEEKGVALGGKIGVFKKRQRAADVTARCGGNLRPRFNS